MLFFVYSIDLVYPHRWNRIIWHFPHLFFHKLNSIIVRDDLRNFFSIWYLFGMDISNCNIYIFREMFSLKVSDVYELKNQLTILGIYNYHGFFLFIAIFIYKNSNHSFCYNFTYSQYPRLLTIFSGVTSSSHLSIVPFMNRFLLRIIFLLLYEKLYISYSIYMWCNSVMIINILKEYMSVAWDKREWKFSPAVYIALWIIENMYLSFHYL